MSFYTYVIRKDPRFASTVPCKDLALVEPGTRAAVLAILADAKAMKLDLRLMETYRSPARQRQLYAKGFTKLKNVGTHGYGVAVDFGVFRNGEYQKTQKPYAFLLDLARHHNMISGQDWDANPKTKNTFMDAGHVQRVPVFRQAALFAGKFYPHADYSPYLDIAASKAKR